MKLFEDQLEAVFFLHDAQALLSSIFHFSIFSAPVASLIMHRLGYRVTMFASGVTAATGLMICVFAENIYVVLLCLGFVMGKYIPFFETSLHWQYSFFRETRIHFCRNPTI